MLDHQVIQAVTFLIPGSREVTIPKRSPAELPGILSLPPHFRQSAHNQLMNPENQ